MQKAKNRIWFTTGTLKPLFGEFYKLELFFKDTKVHESTVIEARAKALASKHHQSIQFHYRMPEIN